METKTELEKGHQIPNDDVSIDNSIPSEILSNDLEECVKDEQEDSKTGTTDDGTSCMVSFQRTRRKFKTSSLFRRKIMYTICLFFCKFIHGWGKGLFGPSYIDIRMISGTDLDQGAWILTSNLIGFALGSILQGVLYGRANNKLTFGMAICVYCVATAFVPWCKMFETMVFAHAVIGLMQGILASGTATDIIRLWGKESRVVFLGSQLMMAFGSAVSPLVVTPFLIELPQEIVNISSSTPLYTIDNNFTDELSSPSVSQSKESQIYIPFSITAVLSLLSGIFFFVMYAKYDRKQINRLMSNSDDSESQRKVPKNVKLFILSMFGSILFIFNGVDEVFTGFLATYCVQFFHWSKKEGALLTFVFFVLIFISRIFGIAIEKWMNTVIFTVVNFVLLCLSVLGMLLISLYKFDTLAWFFAPLFGFVKSCLFPLTFSWTNDYITPVTGRISSFYYTTMMLGGALNPVLLGHLMEHERLIWFCYVLLIESCLILFFLAILVAATRYVVRRFGRACNKTTDKQSEHLQENRSDAV
ncbi:sodium-dependent glucose transporter 1A-like [Mizuhopecten yessoensis]|uniref:Sodium-dependent glucose transporter 1 n=1 Tax=Mizuhopecten yessoensis TaxID=6573 RepID=A0A210R3B6_MIZYE|nr:sodium-dependent glucose transporter 1A-like [Mizuhopecten yessoensis]OWF55465.1 Sodium-dependent glucose transporter 1 [Mizuhopecten yessoensis]